MKKALIICLCVSFSVGCQVAKEEKTALPESVDKVSIIELNGWLPRFDVENDTLLIDVDYESIMGIAEIDKHFDMQIVKRPSTRHNHMYGKIPSPNWVRQAVIETIDNFSSDSLDVDEEPDIYDAHSYFLLIEKKDGQTILLGGYPDYVSEELKKLSYFFRDSTDRYVDKEIENQDSIRTYIRRYDKYQPRHVTLPALPIKKVKWEY